MRLRCPAALPRQQFGLYRYRYAALLGAALAIAPSGASAAARITGTADSVVVRAQDAPLADILSGLGHNFNLRYRSSVALNAPISGTYQGTLRQVVTRLLDGYSFIVKSGPGGIELTVLGGKNAPIAMTGPAIIIRGPIHMPPPVLPAPAR
jgi:hypothetical protein